MSLYYLAYGINTNHDEMNYRCTNPEFLGIEYLPNHQLIFRGPCDVIKTTNKRVACALWKINDQDEKNLDIYEGYPRFYIKRHIKLPNSEIAFYYCMSKYNSRHVAKPSKSYVEAVTKGYSQCGIDTLQLFEALFITNKIIEKELS